MLKTVWAVVRECKIELLENLSVSEGARVLVTLIPDEDEQQFWMSASERSAIKLYSRELSLAEVWENAEDDIYAELLQK
jgi:hypothetical protein